MVDAVGTGALLAADSGPELPTVNDFLPPEILFQGTPFAINRIILIRIVATVVLLVVLGITAKRAKLIPGRWQGVVEMGIDFVRDSVVYQVMGELRGKRYVPMISTLFFTIFVFNLLRHCLQKDVALAIGMSEQVFSNKMNGLRSFSAKDYKALADFFNTSVDYLMGRTLDPWPADNPQPEEAAK